MSELPDGIENVDPRESTDVYLALCALVAEDKRRDAYEFLRTLTDIERIGMLLSGCWITIALADECIQHREIPTDVATWLRAMSLIDKEDGQ